MTKVKKNRHLFWLMDMSLKLRQCINFMDVIGTDIHVYRIVQKDNKRGIRVPVRLIGLSKIMDGIQNIILCQPGNVKNQY